MAVQRTRPSRDHREAVAETALASAYRLVRGDRRVGSSWDVDDIVASTMESLVRTGRL